MVEIFKSKNSLTPDFMKEIFKANSTTTTLSRDSSVVRALGFVIGCPRFDSLQGGI